MKQKVTLDGVAPKPDKKEKGLVRISFEFSGKNLADLDKVTDVTASSAPIEVILKALRFFYLCAMEVQQGSTLMVERDGKQHIVPFL